MPRHVRRFIDCDTANTIVSSLKGARLDYCNALFYGTAANIAQLQRLKNTLARVVIMTRRRNHHISPVLSFLGATGYRCHRELNSS